MGKHGRSGRVFRHRYPVLAAGAVLAVAGVSTLLIGGAPATPVLAGGESPAGAVLAGGESSATASSSGRATDTSTGPRADLRTVTAKDTSTSSPRRSGSYFGLAPMGTALPRSDAYCAAHVQPQSERIPANTFANHTVPSGPVQFGPWGQRVAYFTDVDGHFTGTTGEILEWAACKWGWDQDLAMAEAVRESTWKQSEVGDNGDSFGILQVRVSKIGDPASANSGWGGFPWVQRSTALDADAQMAYLRACYDGDTSWLGNGYQAGNVWGCIGSWFSGQWLSPAADGYISRVQAVLKSKGWLNL